ncbi:MAG: potassium-transporting ATPase subunit F [Actinomycetota bacterium]
MSLADILELVVSALVLGYLGYVLVRPERF